MKKESPGEARKSVLWLGANPSAQMFSEHTNRGVLIRTCNEESAVKEIAVSRAIVFHFTQGDEKSFRSGLEKLGTQALDHGLLVLVLADSDRDFLAMDQLLKSMRLPFQPQKKLSEPCSEFAEIIARHDAGPSEGQVEIMGERVPDAIRLFLCRAFNDCKSITVVSLTDGRSAKVYSVYALFRDSRVGPRPLPFFAKLDKKEKILNEWSKYQNPVGHFIPFQARPDLDPERCFVGYTHGILVGNFVEHSESLLDVARRGDAHPVIYSLFDEALRGWRLQAYVQDEASAFGNSIWDSLEHLFDLTRSVTPLVQRSKEATAFGKVRSPQEILDILRTHGKMRHRLAPCHGDLHAYNVRACRGEAILIDFNSARFSGPLVADPASLEVSLVFEVDAADTDNEGWRSLVDNLYKPEYLHRAPPPPKEPSRREWIWACVRQIRLIALESQETDREYHYALIWHLLRKASFRDESGPDKYRRDYAYYLACRLAEDLEKIATR